MYAYKQTQTRQSPGICLSPKHGKVLIAVLRGSETCSLREDTQADVELCSFLDVLQRMVIIHY